jgi:uncharacterized membrane protein YhhN
MAAAARMIPATIGCAVACVVLVAAEYRRHHQARVISKTTASLAFIAVGVIAAQAAPTGPYPTWILIGLVLGAVGDVALLGRGDHAFLVGLAAFLLGHLAYVVAIAQLAPPPAGSIHSRSPRSLSAAVRSRGCGRALAPCVYRCSSTC